MAQQDPYQKMLELQARMKASEAYILGSTRRYRIQTLGLEGYLDLQEKIRKAEMETHYERLLESKVARAEANLKAEMQKAEAERRKVEAQMRKAEKQKAEAEKQKAEAEKQKAEAEKQKAEAEKQKAEAEKQKAEAEKQKAEVEKQKAETNAETEKRYYQVQSVIALHEQAAFSAERVASILQLPLNEVTFMLSLHKQAVSIDAIVPKLKEFQANLLKNKSL
jgi:chromosome segregation ATPase